MPEATRRRLTLPVVPQDAPARPGGGAAPARAPAAPDAEAGRVRVGLVTLGCDKNTVDSERVMGELLGAGASVTSGVEDVDVVLVNTCGFIDMAKEESVDTLLEAARLKEGGRVRAVVALGCLVQRYKDELVTEMPEVDLFLGLTEAHRLVPELRERGLLPPPERVPVLERPLRVLSSAASHTSYLKISEGCDHACAFCAIPLMRGKHRSTPIERLVAEARELEAAGVVELNVVSQDTSWYGRDWLRAAAAARGDSTAAHAGHGGELAGDVARPAAGVASAPGGAGAAGEDRFLIGRPFQRMAGLRPEDLEGSGAVLPPGLDPATLPRRGLLPELLQALLAGTSVPWIRLFYMYPSGITPELVRLMADEPRILPYLDMPLQHGSDAMLKRMRRPERRATIRERVRWLRDAIPDIALRTTVIVGFPGESEDDFEALVDLLEEVRFDYLGAFAYSDEEGTPAADMGDKVPRELARERLERLLDVQRAITHEKNEARVGTETVVLVDERADPAAGRHAVGRTPAQAREVDGVVYLEGAPDAVPGRLLRARITGADEHDLTARVLGT